MADYSIVCESPYSGAIGEFDIGFSPVGPLPIVDYPKPMTIKSYLYWQYQDDDDLQAFVKAYNVMQKSYSYWFKHIALPIYTHLAGALLDWVGAGLYGLFRPVLGSGLRRRIGPYNTFQFDQLQYNQSFTTQLTDFTPVNDDVYKRILTWHFFKGDGKTFSVNWLKRRVVRFLAGFCGIDPPVDETYRISVTFGIQQINIRLLTHRTFITGGAFYNTFTLNSTRFNGLKVALQPLGPQYVLGPIFKEAVDQSVLELPFQFAYVVQVNDPVGTSFVMPLGARA